MKESIFDCIRGQGKQNGRKSFEGRFEGGRSEV